MLARDHAAVGSDELHQRAGPAVGGEGETRIQIIAGHQDIGSQTRVVQGERAAGAHRILEETVRRRRLDKVRRVDRVAGPETADRGGEGLRLLERERVRAGLADGLPGRDARVELKIGVLEIDGPRAADRSGESLGVGGDRNRSVVGRRSRHVEGGEIRPVADRSTPPLLTKAAAVTLSDADRVELPMMSP